MSDFDKGIYEAKCKISFQKRWLALLAKRNEEQSSSFNFLPNEDKDISSFFAIDIEGNRKIYLPLLSNVNFKQDKRSSSIQITKSNNDFNQNLNEYIEICCINPDNSEFIFNKFNTLASMIFSKIKFEKIDNYSAVKSTIQEWRDFFRLVKKTYLSIEEIRGLIGELYFLNEILNYDQSLFESWHGPESDRHDFRSNNVAVEVKTSGTKNKIIKISSIEQLDKPANSKLFCQLYQLEQDDKSYSIPLLIDEIVEKHNISKMELERKLNDLNYDFNDRKYYEEDKRRFRIIQNQLFEVNQNFPKITNEVFVEKKLPKGVVDINYKINLSDIDDLSLNEKEEIIKKMIK